MALRSVVTLRIKVLEIYKSVTVHDNLLALLLIFKMILAMT